MTIRTSGDSRQTPRISRSASADAFVLTLWTADAAVAASADAAGVQRIGVDLERLGKQERQAAQQTWITPHGIDDLDVITRAVVRAESFARINGLHGGSQVEVEQVVQRGAGVIMAPMIGSAAAACDFAGLVGGRARTVALVETRAGLDHLAAIAATPGIDEVHIGINDLSLSLNLPTRWSVLAGSLLRDASACVRAAGKPFGFGAIGRARDLTLPLPSDFVYAEYARVGATRALMARSFDVHPSTLAADVAAAFARLEDWRFASPDLLAATHAELERRVAVLPAW